MDAHLKELEELRRELDEAKEYGVMVADAPDKAEARIAELDARVRELERKREHTEYWYGTRFERLSQWAREELGEKQKHRFFNIVANGTADWKEAPSYAAEWNHMKHRAESAESALADERERAERLREALEKIAAHRDAGKSGVPQKIARAALAQEKAHD